MKKFEGDTSSKCYWKNVTERLALRSFATKLEFVQKHTVSARHNKTKCNKARFGITQTVITRQSAQLTSIVFTITFPSVNQAQGPCITTR